MTLKIIKCCRSYSVFWNAKERASTCWRNYSLFEVEMPREGPPWNAEREHGISRRVKKMLMLSAISMWCWVWRSGEHYQRYSCGKYECIWQIAISSESLDYSLDIGRLEGSGEMNLSRAMDRGLAFQVPLRMLYLTPVGSRDSLKG